MTNEFPRLVYRKKGAKDFEHALVNTQEDYEAKIADGWYHSVPDALSEQKKPAVNADVSNTQNEDAPPTRAELEAKAKELGLEYHHKTGDAKLLKLINEAIEKAKP